MKNNYLACAFLLLCSAYAYAQPTITTDILFTIGDQATVRYSNTPFAPGPDGADVEWDFSNLNPSYSIEWMVVDPNTTAFRDSFPAATIAFLIPENSAGEVNESTYAYYQQDGNDFRYLGSTLSGGALGATDTSFFTLTQDADDIYNFPLEYGDSGSDVVAGTNTISLQGSPFVTQRTGTTTTEVDGYGTLHTPAGTFPNVLRVKRTEDLSDDFNGIATTQEIVRYDWLSADYRYVLVHTEELIVRDFLGNEQSRSTTTYYAESEIINNTEEEEGATYSIRAYPNPTRDYLSLELPADFQNRSFTARIYNQVGQLISTQAILPSSAQLDVTQLPTGNYWLEVGAGNQRYRSSFSKF